jgi:DmsE family decaheme c-type cytochrome
MINKKIFYFFIFIYILILFSSCQSVYKFRKGYPEIPKIEGAFYTGSDLCLPCHDDIFDQFKKTIHYRISSSETGQAGKGCESCHGPGSIHVKEKGGTDNIINFVKLSPDESSEICLTCHNDSPLMNWRENYHILNAVSCVECHKPHMKTESKMVYLGDPEICYLCHQDIKAQNMLPSHHPVKENKMKCSDCHNPHGSVNGSIEQESPNMLCFKCHAEYQGPFIYEHEPAFEDCSICHEPHGTIANNLLRQDDPFICLRCHKGHRDNPKTGSHPTVASFLTSCVQCHSQVHGSDLPSQLNGNGLTR